MEKFKIIVIILIVFLLSGCSMNYSLKINEDKTINEQITINNIEYLNDNTMLTPTQYFFQGLLYNAYSTNEDNYNATGNWEDFNDYLNSSVLFDKLLDSNSITYDGTNVKVDLTTNSDIESYIKSFGQIDSLTFSLNIPYYVSKHNANKVEGNNYIWIIDDLDKAHIKINFDMSKDPKFLQNIISKILIIIFIVLIIGVIIYFINKNKEVNEI